MYTHAPAIVIEKPRQAEIQEIPLSAVDDQTVVVQTTYSAISTGTEMKVWSGLSGALGGELWYPLVPGYEEVGKVVHVGSKVGGFKIGDRVMANECRHYPKHCHAWGGQCATIIKSPKTSPSPFDGPVKIPDNVTDQEAVLAYLACVSHKGFVRVNPQAGHRVLVIGAGMIGISWMQLAKLAGCQVIAMDTNDRRLKLASRFADEVIDAKGDDPVNVLGKLTDSKMADIVVEASGDPAVVTHLYRYLKDGGWGLDDAPGHIHLQADYPSPLIVAPYQSWFVKNMNLSMTCAIRPDSKATILSLISQGKFDVKSILSSDMMLEIPFDQAQKGYEMIEQSKKDIFKVLLKW